MCICIFPACAQMSSFIEVFYTRSSPSDNKNSASPALIAIPIDNAACGHYLLVWRMAEQRCRHRWGAPVCRRRPARPRQAHLIDRHFTALQIEVACTMTISDTDLANATTAWGEGIISLSQAYEAHGIAQAKEVAGALSG